MYGFKKQGLDSPNKIERDAMEREKTMKTSFATMSRNSSGISITFSGSSQENEKLSRRGSGKDYSGFGTPTKSRGLSPAANNQNEDIGLQLTAVKLKLEERRKKIEDEKKKMESLMSRQREKVGQEAFLRAVSKGIKKAGQGTRDIPNTAQEEILELATKVDDRTRGHGPEGGRRSEVGEVGRRPFSLRLGDRLAEQPQSDVQTPEVEAQDISRMSDSLYSLQNDIQRLALQQTQIQNLMNTGGVVKGTSDKPFYISQPAPQSNQNKPFFMSQQENQGRESFYNQQQQKQQQQQQQQQHHQQPQLPATSPNKTTHTPQRRTWGEPRIPQDPRFHPGYTPPHQNPEYDPPHHNPGHAHQPNQGYAPSPPSQGYPGYPLQPNYPSQPAYPFDPSNSQPTYPFDPSNGQPTYQFDQFGRPIQHWPNQPPAPGLNPQFPVYQAQPPPSTFAPPPSTFAPPYAAPQQYVPPRSYSQPPSYAPPQPPSYAPSSQAGYQKNGDGDYSSLNRTFPSRSISQHDRSHEDLRNLSAADIDDVDRGGRRSNLSAADIDDVDRSGRRSADYRRRDLSRTLRNDDLTQVVERKKPATAEKPSLSASFLIQKRRNAEQEVNSPRPRSTNFEQLTAGRSRDQLDQLSSGRSREQLSSGRSQLSSREQLDEFGVITPRRFSQHFGPESSNNSREQSTERMDSPTRSHLEVFARGREGTPGGGSGGGGRGREEAPGGGSGGSTTFAQLGSSPNTHIFARLSPIPVVEPMRSESLSHDPEPVIPRNQFGQEPVIPRDQFAPEPVIPRDIEPEMTSSALETLSAMKTETIGDTSEGKGFVISFSESTPVKPKPALRPRRMSRKDDKDDFDERSESKCKLCQASVDSDPDLCRKCLDVVTKCLRNNRQISSCDCERCDDCLLAKCDQLGLLNKIRENQNSEMQESSMAGNTQPWSPVALGNAQQRSPVAPGNFQQRSPIAAGNTQQRSPVAAGHAQHCSPVAAGHAQESQVTVADVSRENRKSEAMDLSEPPEMSVDEKRKEWVEMMTLRRRQQVEEGREKRELEANRRREEEEAKKADAIRKKEEDRRRREEILEQYKHKKELEDVSRPPSRRPSVEPPPSATKFGPKLRPRSAGGKPRPKTIHVDNEDISVASRSVGLRGSQSNLSMSSIARNKYHHSNSLRRGSNVSLHDEDIYSGSLRGLGHIGRSKSSSASNLGPGSLPLGLRQGRSGGRDFDDGASDMSSTTSGYRSGRGSARLYREPVSKSNRPLMMNAVEFVVFPGAVNKETRIRVLEEIERCECPHFLLLFRDSRLQFRGLYAFYPDTEEVFKIYGTGPKQINDNMMELYYKYNSGGKKFTQIHTKHLTVTIDAFTIHNSLWQGKRAKLPDKKAMPLVI